MATIANHTAQMPNALFRNEQPAAGKKYTLQKTALLLITLLVFGLKTSAQKLSGKITDNKANPIELATMQLFSAKDTTKPLQITLSDSTGFFLFNNLSKGNYLLKASYLHYPKVELNFSLEKDTVLNIAITTAAQDLGNVSVTAKKPLIERKIDRLVFNVEQSIGATGGTALEALQITPRVRVQQEGLSIIGKSGVAVMVDDRLIQLSGNELMSFLAGIPTSNIQSIEVITTPPAQYDAQGNSGIINIKLKKAKVNQWNAALRGTYVQRNYSSGTVGGSFDYQKNKLAFYAFFDWSKSSYQPEERNNVYYSTETWREEANRRDFRNFLNGRIGIEYKFSNMLSIGAHFVGYYNEPLVTANTVTSIYKVNFNTTAILQTISRLQVYTNLQSINLNPVIKLDTVGNKLTLNFNYYRFSDSRDRNFYTIDTTAANNKGTQKIDNYSLKFDFESPLKKINLKYGGKISFSKTFNSIQKYITTSGVPIFDPTESNDFDYTENVQALYFSASKNLGKKWETSLGFRGEFTQTIGNSLTLSQINKNNYFKLFPTFFLSYAPNDKTTWSLSVNRRINRPGFNWLNPFRWYSNPYVYFEGNPFLQPSYTYNVELAYTRGNWNATTYFSHTTEGAEQFTIIDNQSYIQKTIPLNYFNTDKTGLNATYTYDKLKWLMLSPSLDIYYSYTKALLKISEPFLKGWNLESSLNADFTLNKNKTFFFNLYCMYISKGVDGLERNTSFERVDLGIKLLVLKKKLQINLNGYDVFKTNSPMYTSYTNGIKLEYQNYYSYRRIALTLSYKFGNKNINIQKKSFGNEEEQNRAK